MSEEEQTKKEQQKQDEHEAAKKVAKTGAKAAANAYAGPAGGAAVDLVSKTKLGDKVLDAGAQALNKNPAFGKVANIANKTGALDAADKAINSSSGGLDTANNGLSNLSTSLPNNEQKKDSDSSLLNENNGESEELSDDNVLDPFLKKHKFTILGIIIAFLFIIIIGVLIISIAYSVSEVANNFFNGIVDFFTTDQQEEEQDYYNTLKDVQTDIHNEYGICIDMNLITAALTINTSVDNMLEEGQEPSDDAVDNPDYDSEDPNGEESIGVSYKKMKKQIKLLANMQMLTKKYVLDNSSGSYCSESEEIYLITEGSKDSSTKELVAQHDLTGFAAFFTKKSNEEKNWEYYVYKPPFEIVEVKDATGKIQYNADGSVKTIKVCNPRLPGEEKELSIGTLETREDSVFYWNLVNSFIPDYYDEYLPDSEPERTERVKEMAEEIYLLYTDIGPSQGCSTSYNFICRNDEGSNYYSGSGSTSEARTEFMEKISPVAISEMTRTGVYASVTMAQAALESGNGASGLSTKYSNYYGMTAGSCAPSASPSSSSGTIYRTGEGGNTCSGNDFWDGTVVAMCNSSGNDCQWYRVYDSFENSTRDHSRLLSDRYGCNVYANSTDQLNCIKNHGYATDPNYVEKVLSVINTYNLTQYDVGNWDGTISDYDGPTYTDKMCYNGGSTNTGTFTSWKQYDKAWSSVKLGPSNVGTIGCAMTSVAIQIMRSGSPVTIEDFNPGTFAQALTSVGAFDSRGNISWAKVERVAPNFKFVDRTNDKPSLEKLNELVSQGYYVILNVKYGRHWVAVDSVDLNNNKIYMFDPGSSGTEVGETYKLDSIMGYAYYRRS